jgi:(p)ppGpp synthase/HD superfamily hydrolase
MKLTDAVMQTIALLHDTIEDAGFTADELRKEGFSDFVVESVQTLTHTKDRTYMEYIGKIADAPTMVRLVKLADIEDNLDASRPFKLPDSLRKKYLKAKAILESTLEWKEVKRESDE